MYLYKFRDKEWEALAYVVDRYSDATPVFVEELVERYMVTHSPDKMILDETELNILLNFFRCVEEYMQDVDGSSDDSDDGDNNNLEKDEKEETKAESSITLIMDILVGLITVEINHVHKIQR